MSEIDTTHHVDASLLNAEDAKAMLISKIEQYNDDIKSHTHRFEKAEDAIEDIKKHAREETE